MAGCALCPRRCGADRSSIPGRCGGGALPKVCLAAPHFHEEPAISGKRGSGTVFFSGCSLGCAFCQNHAISRPSAAGRPHTPGELAGVFLGLAAKGVHNLNLVTPTHERPAILEALAAAREKGFALPVIWNSGGYENEEAAAALKKDVDIHLTDLKFHSPTLSAALADAPDYFERASVFLKEACRYTGPPRFDEEGMLLKGVVVRLLVLPGQGEDALALLSWLAKELPEGRFLLSLMSQYTPPSGLDLPKPLNRRLFTYEYRKAKQAALDLSLNKGWFQGRASATEDYLPDFSRGRA